jgi:phospholipid/cholesterol/gamma-HCH transport system substrate-binding protein
MLKYRSPGLVKVGFLGFVLIVLTIAVGLHPQQLVSIATDVRYRALFNQAGGLAVGNAVTVSGVKVGTVEHISLSHGYAEVSFAVGGNVALGSETTAHIRTGSLLGERVVTLTAAGKGRMRPRDVIPVSRTSSPYSLTDAVSQFTTNTEGTDTATLNHALDTLSATLDQIAPQLRPTFDGLTRLSQSLNGRDQALRELLKNAGAISGVLSQKSQKINSLLLNADDLVGVLNDRRLAIANLLANTAVVAKQLSGLVADNQSKLAPALERLNAVTAILEKNRDNIAKAIPGLTQFELTQGESVASGYYYNAFIPNIALGQLLQPFLDYYFGFRRGVNAGQPPDHAGPRAEIPIPRNALPPPGVYRPHSG